MYFFGRIGSVCFITRLAVCFYFSVFCFMEYSISGRALLVLGILLILLGMQFILTGGIGNLLVDITHWEHYRDNHIKKIV